MKLKVKIGYVETKSKKILHYGLLTYNPLNMFRALLCPSSGARDYTGDYGMWHMTFC